MRRIKAVELFAGMCGEDLIMPMGVVVESVSTDSRTVEPGALFFAICGDNFDGHGFVLAAFEKGAVAAVLESSVVEQPALYEEILHYATENGRAIFLCHDSRIALGEAAAVYLKKFSPVVVAVTGSSGKTTTRSVIEGLLRSKFAVHATRGNLNNDIGMPLTIFGLSDEHQLLLLEMGMNHAGELAWLAKVAQPDIAIITNIGTAHIEFFKSQSAIAAAKKEIFSCFDERSVAVVNKDDQFYDFLIEDVPGEKLSFSVDESDFSVNTDLGVDGYLLDIYGKEIHFSLGGLHNLSNLAAGIVVAKKLGLSEQELLNSIPAIQVDGARSRVVKGRFTIIDDCYNANPESMRSGLCLLKNQAKSRRIAVLGDMYELGAASKEQHHLLGEWCAQGKVADLLLLVGHDMKHCEEGALKGGFGGSVLLFSELEKIKHWLADNVCDGDTLFVKGSRGMHLEQVVSFLIALQEESVSLTERG